MLINRSRTASCLALLAAVLIAGCAPGQTGTAARTGTAGPTGAAGGLVLGGGAGDHSVGVPALRGYRWHRLPRAPIAGRSGGVGVWTGRELLVWGGSDGHDGVYADGAAYDPATHRWSTLPRSPLRARTDPAFAWAGSRLFIWGGQDLTRLDHDGATYDPATRRWTKLPRLPAAANSAAITWTQAYAVGSRVVLLSTSGARTHTAIDATAYDPASNTWTKLPSVHLVHRHDGDEVVAVAADARLYVWSLWSHATRHTDGSFDTRTGVDGYTFDAGRRTWTRNRLTPDRGMASDQPLWTGRRVLLPAEDIWCGFCPGPWINGRTGLSLDPRTGARLRIPHGPVDDLGATYRWTGAALLAVNSTAERSGGGAPTDRPGEAAAWDPTTRAWTRLPSAPAAGGSVVVWTGRSVIVWGELLTPKGNRVTATGMELSAR